MNLQNFAKRVAVAVVAIPILLYIFILGEVYFEILIAVISFLSVEELLSMQNKKGWQVNRWLSRLIYAVILAVGFYASNLFPAAILGGAIIIFVAEVWRKNPDHLAVSTNSIFNMIYPITFFVTIVWLRHTESSALLPVNFVLFIFISIWIMDTFAYLGGVSLGRHKLIPRVSPNKTVEGALFGFTGALGTWLIASRFGFCPVSISQALVIGGSVGVVGQIGDLFESLLKRDVGIKDSSSFLPGHGGILDRFDSLLFVSPVIWIITQLW